MIDQETRDRLSRVEQRFDRLDERLNERSKNLRDVFYELERRVDSLREDLNGLINTLEQGA